MRVADANYWIESASLGEKWTLLRQGTSWSSPVATRRDALMLPQRHGQRRVTPLRFDATPLSFAVTLRADTPEALDAERNALMQLITQNFVTLVRENGTRRVSAKAELLNVGEATNFLVAERATIPFTLLIPGVFFTGPTQTHTVPVVAGVEKRLTLPTDSSAPIMDLRVTFTAPADYVSIKDVTTGGWLRLNRLNLLSGSVTLHTGDLTAIKTPAVDVRGSMERSPGFRGIQPRNGVIALDLSRSKPATASTVGAVTVTFSPHYF